MKKPGRVRVWTEQTVIPTYLPGDPDRNPMFLDRRVYQGSSGRIYPLPFTDRIAERPVDREWQCVWLENEYLRVMILPEIGGRIHVAQDKTNGYDFIYRQSVIKPALVGLAGPWISGGIELNWPQHHRPATFLPVQTQLEENPDGSKTVWLSDHDPLCRMKGMHGVCLHPDRGYLELKVRVYNRTPWIQTFLWWANVAVRVHEAYQSFFPPDVQFVADHAKRAMSRFPRSQGRYYGVDYRARARSGSSNFKSEISDLKSQMPPRPGNDLSWYANIPVPTSYMALGSREDFFGGYDHARQAGLVHIANHHIAPGKKQWTWGNHEFGYAWDRNLTDTDGPYIELMAGVYTDNQPDFSFLQPGETKTWSQFWYPIQKIGPAHHANLDAAVRLDLDGKRARVGISVTKAIPGAAIRLEHSAGAVERKVDLRPGRPFLAELKLSKGKWRATRVSLRVLTKAGQEIIVYSPQPRQRTPVPPPATEPPPPPDVQSVEELYLTGLHLEQYRHATRDPEPYWREALRRDPRHSRSHSALGLRHLYRGEWALAEMHFRSAIERLTRRNPNPADGAPFHNLGLCLRYQLDAMRSSPRRTSSGRVRSAHVSGQRLFDAAYAAFYKAAWNQAWAAPSYHALAELDCRQERWLSALEHLDRSLRLNSDNLRARNLKVMVLRKLSRDREGGKMLHETLALDPLDGWARYLKGEAIPCDVQARLDVALDLAQAGFLKEAIGFLESAGSVPETERRDRRIACQKASRHKTEQRPAHPLPTQDWGTAPLLEYYRGWFRERLGDHKRARVHYGRAARQSPDYCFPGRLEEILILQSAMRANPGDARAPYYLGNLFYDRRRRSEAVSLWQRSARLDPTYAVVWRNLGLAYFNVTRQPQRARAAYDRAFRANPDDARLLYERDQLWKRLGLSPARRLRELEKHLRLVRARDDLSVELCALYNQTGQNERALEVISTRQFQPWEGGEGLALGQHVRTHLALGRAALNDRNFAAARDHFKQALASPPNLGEAKHWLANQSDIHYYLGLAYHGLGQRTAAKRHWRAAATFRGDFQEMRVRAFSEMTYFSAVSWGRLGHRARMRKMLRELLNYAQRLERAPATIDYFATSLPALLLFEDDLQGRQETAALFLQAQAWVGLGDRVKAKRLLAMVLRRDPNHPQAADWLKAPPV